MEDKTIVLAAGCFWGAEKMFRSLPGVRDVMVGYANGRSPELANYEAVCSGITGFREAVRVTYDPSVISLRHLLFAFYAVIDPTMWHRQGMDIGSHYQTGIYWENASDENTIRTISDLEKSAVSEFYVELTPLQCFYPAEAYHQRYLEKTPGGYCHIAPWRMASVVGFPFTDELYTHPAKELLHSQTCK